MNGEVGESTEAGEFREDAWESESTVMVSSLSNLTPLLSTLDRDTDGN